ncbi:MAG: translation initiation factor [Rikenellaceae bacterium]
MSSNDWKSRLGMVYSTNADFEYTSDESEEQSTFEPSKQDLRVWLDRKQRGGKVATIVKGFVGAQSDLEDLARMLKTKCGVGGAAKSGEIIVQGDHRDRVVDILIKSGYRCKRAGG